MGEFSQFKRENTDKEKPGVIFIAKVVIDGNEFREESEDMEEATIRLRNHFN